MLQSAFTWKNHILNGEGIIDRSEHPGEKNLDIAQLCVIRLVFSLWIWKIANGITPCRMGIWLWMP